MAKKKATTPAPMEPPLPKPFPHRLIILLLIPVLLILASYFLIFKDLPTPVDLKEKPPAQSTKILDRNGKLIYSIYVSENRTIVPLSAIPKNVQQATIAIEDKDFYHHGGINFVGGIFRAIKDMVIYQHVEGGSTITQQLIKKSLLSDEQTVQRKIKEALPLFCAFMLYSRSYHLFPKHLFVFIFVGAFINAGLSTVFHQFSWAFWLW